MSNRQVIGGTANPAFILNGFQIHEVEQHVTGRNAAAAEVLAGAAVLCANGWVSSHAAASYTGAQYQDATGTPLHPRAHRFPCNPTLGGQSLPRLAARFSPVLSNALKQPLAATDLLPIEANYADNLFEASGACDAVLAALEKILKGQRAGKAVDADLVKEALAHDLLPGFLAAYDEAYRKAQAKDNPNVPPFSILEPGLVERLNERSIHMPMTPNRPKTNIEGVGDILLLEKNMAAKQIGTGGMAAAIPAIVTRLMGLALLR
jgi:hypothetical protein